MYDRRKQTPFYPLKNQVKSPGAALTRMTACCYKVKFCYFPPVSMQRPMAKEYWENSIWFPCFSLHQFLDNSLKGILSLRFFFHFHFKVSRDSREKVETETMTKWPLFLYVRGCGLTWFFVGLCYNQF